jgi:hypothetical protein
MKVSLHFTLRASAANPVGLAVRQGRKGRQWQPGTGRVVPWGLAARPRSGAGSARRRDAERRARGSQAATRRLADCRCRPIRVAPAVDARRRGARDGAYLEEFSQRQGNNGRYSGPVWLAMS